MRDRRRSLTKHINYRNNNTMNTKQLSLGLLTGLIATTGVASIAYGAQGERGDRGDRRAQLSEEVRTELRSAFADNNYSAYTDIASENEMKRVLTEEQFEDKVERHANHESAKEAVLAGDYDAWRSVVGDERATDVTESNFDLLTDLAEARESEDEEAIEEAKQALTDAGIEKKMKGGKGKHRGGHGPQTN